MNKDKQSSFRDRLYDILEAVRYGDRNGLIHDAHKAVIDLVKSELVPNEYVVGSRTDYEVGFNKCRQEILDKLGN